MLKKCRSDPFKALLERHLHARNMASYCISLLYSPREAIQCSLLPRLCKLFSAPELDLVKLVCKVPLDVMLLSSFRRHAIWG